MKSFLRVLLTLPAAAILFSGCQKSLDARVNTDADIQDLKGTIIYKFGFENNNHDTSAKGWTSSGYNFSKDVPPGGGLWSLSVVPGRIPQQGYAEHYIVFDTGHYQLKFGCYTKVSGFNGTGVGYLRLFKQHKDGSRNALAERSFTNTTWTTHAVSASFHIQPGDIIVLQLSAGTSELAAWQTFFDNARVELQ